MNKIENFHLFYRLTPSGADDNFIFSQEGSSSSDYISQLAHDFSAFLGLLVPEDRDNLALALNRAKSGEKVVEMVHVALDEDTYF